MLPVSSSLSEWSVQVSSTIKPSNRLQLHDIQRLRQQSLGLDLLPHLLEMIRLEMGVEGRLVLVSVAVSQCCQGAFSFLSPSHERKQQSRRTKPTVPQQQTPAPPRHRPPCARRICARPSRACGRCRRDRPGFLRRAFLCPARARRWRRC